MSGYSPLVTLCLERRGTSEQVRQCPLLNVYMCQPLYAGWMPGWHWVSHKKEKCTESCALPSCGVYAPLFQAMQLGLVACNTCKEHKKQLQS